MERILIRTALFIFFLTLFGFLEYIFPRRNLSLPRRARWVGNFSLVVISNILVAVLAVGINLLAWEEYGFSGILKYLDFPWAVEAGISVLVLDLLIYVQHFAFHKIPVLWRIHRTHHTDSDMDISTAQRFHPLEILISYLYKLFWIVILGIDPGAVIVFEVLLSSAAIFNHSNWRLSLLSDRILRFIVITPDLHRIHHSIHPSVSQSNYGFFLSIWDRLFRTLRKESPEPQKTMVLGVLRFTDREYQRLDRLLATPFLQPRGKKGV